MLRSLEVGFLAGGVGGVGGVGGAVCGGGAVACGGFLVDGGLVWGEALLGAILLESFGSIAFKSVCY